MFKIVRRGSSSKTTNDFLFIFYTSEIQLDVRLDFLEICFKIKLNCTISNQKWHLSWSTYLFEYFLQQYLNRIHRTCIQK